MKVVVNGSASGITTEHPKGGTIQRNHYTMTLDDLSPRDRPTVPQIKVLTLTSELTIYTCWGMEVIVPADSVLKLKKHTLKVNHLLQIPNDEQQAWALILLEDLCIRLTEALKDNYMILPDWFPSPSGRLVVNRSRL